VLVARRRAPEPRRIDLVHDLRIRLAAVANPLARVRDAVLLREHGVERVASRAVRVKQRPVDVEQVDDVHAQSISCGMRGMVLCVLVAGCSKSAPPPVLDPPKPFALTGLGLQLDAPGNATIVGQSASEATLTWPAVRLWVRNNSRGLNASSLESAAAAVTNARITKRAQTADGWELRYDDTLAGDTVYTVSIHRTIAEVALECGGSSDSTAGADSIAAACATLRPR
jgi:hypothetical protein